MHKTWILWPFDLRNRIDGAKNLWQQDEKIKINPHIKLELSKRFTNKATDNSMDNRSEFIWILVKRDEPWFSFSKSVKSRPIHLIGRSAWGEQEFNRTCGMQMHRKGNLQNEKGWFLFLRCIANQSTQGGNAGEGEREKIHGLVVGVGDDQQHVPAPPVAAERGQEGRARGHACRRGEGEDPTQRDRPQQHGSRREGHPEEPHALPVGRRASAPCSYHDCSVLRGCEVTSGVSGRPSRRRRGELDGSRCLSEMRSHD